MYLVAIAWIYVVLMMAVAEAMSTQGTVLGGIITFVLYGVLPLGIVLYIMGTPMRRRARLAAEAAEATEAEQAAADAATAPAGTIETGAPVSAATLASAPRASAPPDGSSHAPAGSPVAPVRKEG